MKSDETAEMGAIQTSWGWVAIARTVQGVYASSLPHPSEEMARQSLQLPANWELYPLSSVDPSLEMLAEYFRGGRVSFPYHRCDLRGYSPFFCRVYRELLAVSYGERISYGELAVLAGHPRAARSVGSAMRANRLPILIPCHRVVLGNGHIGFYAGGPEGALLKERLLGMEKSGAQPCA